MKKVLSILIAFTIVCGAAIAFPTSSNAISKKTVSEKKEYKENGTVILKYNCKRDVLNGSKKAIKKTNSSIKSIKDKTKNEYLANAKSNYYNGSTTFPHSLNISIKVYESGKYYSFKFEKSGYWGGAHTGHDVYGYTYKKSNGKKVSALSVIKDKKKLLKKIKKAFYNQFKSKGSDPDYMCNWLGIDNSTLKSYTYYLKGKYIYASLNFGSVMWLTGTVKVKQC